MFSSVILNKLTTRLPKVLVTLFMMFALILQASAGSACAIGCLLGVCGSKQVSTVHQDHHQSGGGCCDHEEQESKYQGEKGNIHRVSSAHNDVCGCPNLANCNLAIPTSTHEASGVQVPNIDLPVILAETLTPTFGAIKIPEPGHYGNDSGPPLCLTIGSLSPRAPPVALISPALMLITASRLYHSRP